MAKTSTVKSKHASKHATNGSGIRNSKVNDPKKRSSSENAGVSKKKAPKTGKGSIPLKGKAGNAPGGVVKKKRRIYTEKELGIPQLNMITPVGVEKPKGGKKGKVFVDDKESMMTILSMVHAEKDGQIESKMMKARQMEEIREARKAEAEKRQEMRKNKLEETKEGLRRKRNRRDDGGDDKSSTESILGTKPLKLKRKSVSFAQT